MTDSHTHLTEEPLYSSIESYIKSFTDSGGESLLNVAHNLDSIYKSLDLCKRFQIRHDLQFHQSFGLHPELFAPESDIYEKYDSNKKAQKALDQLEQLVERHIGKLSAIGETGLDYHEFLHNDSLSSETKETFLEIQKYAFRRQLELARKYSLPLTIHTRDKIGESRCFEDAVKAVSEVGEGTLHGSFHSYTGPLEQLKTILDLGFYVGFNAIITYKSADNVRELLKETPLERVLLETDAPFLPTHSVRSSSNERKYAQPSDVLEIAQHVADIKGLPKEKVLQITEENFKRLFGERD